MPTKKVCVNFSNAQSIRKAERQKSALENKGYNQKSTKQTGLNKFQLTYFKPKRKR